MSDSPLDATKARQLVCELPNMFVDYQFYGNHYYTYSHGSDIPRWEMGFKNKEGVTFRVHDEELLINKFLAGGYCIRNVLKPFVFKYSKKDPKKLFMGFPKATDVKIDNELLYKNRISKSSNNYSKKTFEVWANSLEEIKLHGVGYSIDGLFVKLYPRSEEVKEIESCNLWFLDEDKIDIPTPRCMRDADVHMVLGKLVPKVKIDEHRQSLSLKQKQKFDAISKGQITRDLKFTYKKYTSKLPFAKFSERLEAINKEIISNMKIK